MEKLSHTKDIQKRGYLNKNMALYEKDTKIRGKEKISILIGILWVHKKLTKNWKLLLDVGHSPPDTDNLNNISTVPCKRSISLDL